MRKWVVGTATAVLVSCGSSSSPPPPSYDGGIVGTPPGGSSGFVFTPVDGAALTIGQTSCTVSGTPVKITGLFVGFSSFPGVCDFARTHGVQCLDSGKASATFVAITIADIDLLSAAAIAPGIYSINTQVPTGTGTIVTEGIVSVTDAACADSGPASTALSGTITITSASAAEVKGSVNLTWTGGAFTGPFDVVGCTASVDICGLANNTLTCSGCF